MINKTNKKNTAKILIISIIALLTTSCELIMFDRANPSTDPHENFNYLWNEIDKKYSYFEYKNLDWDAVKSKYEVQLRDSMSDEELFDVLANMMIELRDDHSNLIAP